MEQQHDSDMDGTIARYRLGGQVHWIQAGKAWEERRDVEARNSSYL